MRFYVGIFRCIYKYLSDPPANRLSHLAVHGPKATKEAALPFEGLVNKLINDN